MEAGQWERAAEIFEQAADLPPAERPAFLARACAGDDELRREVESLLASEMAGGFTGDLHAAVANLVGGLPMTGDELTGALIGTRIGPYTVTGLIGRGGMGVVYRAVREGDFRMEVAIKLLKRGTDTDAALTRFRTERQILAGLQHPNIARLLDGGATGNGLPYFVMEYVEGTPLLEYAAQLSVRDRLELFRSICAAVHYAHQNKVVHRDIKPSNILVTADGVPKLLDFGIAKALDPESGAGTTLSGRLMTPEYASPEQLRGEPVAPATDIYSLGAVLYELLTGRWVRSSGEPRRPSALVRGIDKDLDRIVSMALREEPEGRYPTAEALSEDVSRVLHDLPVHARKTGVLYRCRKFVQRNWALLMAVLITALVAAALAAVWKVFEKFEAGAGPATHSIAVLPLANVSGDQQQEYFADGMTDALISGLARIHALRVTSRTSAMTYKGARRPLPAIARSLGVQRIVEGSVLRAGNRVRIDVRLIDAKQDRPAWSRSYEGDLADVLALQQQVALAVAREIGAAITEPERMRATRHQRVDLGAYDAYLKGREQYLADFNDVASLKKATAFFERALALDPSYAPAYVGLAECYYMGSSRFYPPAEAIPKARSAALKAIALDDTLGGAHAILALVRSVYDFNPAEAGKEFRRALELEPSNALAHLWYGSHLVTTGQFDAAIQHAEEARKLDPASPGSNAYMGALLYFAGRYDQVIERMQPLVDMYPDSVEPRWWMAMAHAQRGEWAKAIPMAEDCCRKLAGPPGDTSYCPAQLGRMYADAGRAGDARRVLGELEQLAAKRPISAYTAAVLSAGLGEREQAFRWLREAWQKREEETAYVNVDPRLKVLRSDARWAEVVRRVGLEP